MTDVYCTTCRKIVHIDSQIMRQAHIYDTKVECPECHKISKVTQII